MKVKCLENSSKTLPYYEGFVYEAEPLPGEYSGLLTRRGNTSLHRWKGII